MQTPAAAPPPPRVLSVDVGISNLCCCLLTRPPGPPQRPEFRIARWDIINLGTCDIGGACEALAPKLLELPYLDEADVVLIEQQTAFNTKMKVMSHAIQSFFVTRRALLGSARPEVAFISPRRKLQVYAGPPIAVTAKNEYKANKKRAIEHCKSLIAEDPLALKFLMGLRKKDDAADAFLQGAFYLRSLATAAQPPAPSQPPHAASRIHYENREHEHDGAGSPWSSGGTGTPGGSGVSDDASDDSGDAPPEAGVPRKRARPRAGPQAPPGAGVGPVAAGP